MQMKQIFVRIQHDKILPLESQLSFCHFVLALKFLHIFIDSQYNDAWWGHQMKQVQLERLRSENTPALSPMNKFKNIIQFTPWLILETTIEHFDKWTDKSQTS